MRPFSSTGPISRNDTLARHFWPDAPAIGQRIQVLEPGGGLVEVVGIAKTTTLGFPGELPQNGIYFPFRQRLQLYMTFVAATDGEETLIVVDLPAPV